MDVLKFLNPLTYMSREEYAEFWIRVFQTIFYGFWGKLFACCLFTLGLWFAIRKQRLRTAAIFYFLAFTLAYGGGIYRFLTSLLK